MAPGAKIQLDQVAIQACWERGLSTQEIKLIRHFSNAVFLVSGVIVRVGYGPHAVAKAGTAVTTALWLCQRDYPATPPLDDHAADALPTVASLPDGGQAAVTFWRYLPQPRQVVPPDFGALGRMARALHEMPWEQGPELPPHRPLTTLRRTLLDPSSRGVLGATDHSWLVARAEELTVAASELESPLGSGAIHGDLYAGNLLRTDSPPGWLLGDWDGACLGAREVDLVPTMVGERFGLPQEDIEAFVRGYGHDVRGWSGYPAWRDIRELSTLPALIRHGARDARSREELKRRVDSLRSGDRTVRWIRQ